MAFRLSREREEGPVEYKSRLSGDDERCERLATQMKYRLFEGGGEAIYVLGVGDDGTPVGLDPEGERETLDTLRRVAESIGAATRVLERAEFQGRSVLRVLVRVSREESPPVQVTIAVMGNVDAGKSTTVGTLCTGELDDGRGRGMRRVARYSHEIITGRTSSVVVRLLGFDMEGKPVNWNLPNPLDEAQIYLASKKIVYFVDVGGHERYLRTALRGVMSRLPDYVMLVVAANSGLQVMGREHLGVSLALRIPVFAVVTKVDLVDKSVLEATLIDTVETLRRVDRKPVLVKSLSEVYRIVELMPSGRVVPVFLVSNTTGEGLELLTEFLNLLPPRKRWAENVDKPLLAYVSETYDVKGVGPVVAVSIERGVIREGEDVYLGPLRDASWRRVRVKSIHINRVVASSARAGEEATLALAGVDFDELEKGLVVSSKPLEAVWEVAAHIVVLRHPTTIRTGYQTVLHAHSIRSPVKFTYMSREPMRTGDSGSVRLRFLNHPWYIEPGTRIILRDSRTRAIGTVTSAYHS
ncbi:GTP-binding protein [Thermofilum pendens]|uniref:Translation elongation factor 1A GTP binding domain family n=1 Tax=Thermofilum pendens (strain DSM 2475 / Hrk 5) TaxID=368408 RepID=A1RWG7_THEPD|nr:GTP-binding protein [Thermofilum pendens]ABL77547.1 translation elongation factor 1A GTP binding domain family [Thermofilum pendens Hrk 5]